MKGLGITSAGIAAVACFAASAVAQLDPIVIKVRSLNRLSSLCLWLTKGSTAQGSKFFYKTNGTEL